MAEQFSSTNFTLIEKKINKSINEKKVQKPRVPVGLIIKTNIEDRVIIRQLLPNEGKDVSDKFIFDFINKILISSNDNLIEKKRKIGMIFHQSIKRDRTNIINFIFELWKKKNFPTIELIDSIYDNCKPITQAGWCGSINCLRTIVSIGGDVNNINNKNETLLDTINKGKEYYISKSPSMKQFIIHRFKECYNYIITVKEIINLQQNSESINSKESTEIIDSKISTEIIDSKISTESITSTESIISIDSVEINLTTDEINKLNNMSEYDMTMEIVNLYTTDIKTAKKYYDYINKKEYFDSINNILCDEGIIF
jgi:hypothetical protein